MAAPSRPFGSYPRVSSVESISSMVDKKWQNTQLNKAITSVRSRASLSYDSLTGVHTDAVSAFLILGIPLIIIGSGNYNRK